LTTKLLAFVDALGLPLRILPTPGQWGDCPQAAALIEGFDGVGHVIADAAYDADHFRRLIRDNLDAEAQIPSNPSRAGALPLDRALHAERRLIENFFNRLKRFRRIALRCEKTLPAFMAFVHLACAMDWLR
jgi:putative transposase